MQKALEKGEVPEEELRALESDVTGKVGISGIELEVDCSWNSGLARFCWLVGVVLVWKSPRSYIGFVRMSFEIPPCRNKCF
jgi:hypothetical protein